MRWPKWGLAGLAGLAGVSFWMLLAGPDQLLGVELGNAGIALLLVVAWTALYGVSAAPRGELDETVSPGEWRAWVGLGFTAMVAAYLALKADVIVGAVDLRDLGGIGRSVVLLLVAWAVISQLLAGRWKGQVLEDERDREIERIAASGARIALVVVVLGVVALLGLTPVDRLAWATPIAISHLLLFGLVLHSLVEYAVTAGAYWRDRHG